MENVEIDRRFEPFFRIRGLTSFDSFMNFADGEVIKRISTRDINRFKVSMEGKERAFYLKRHSCYLTLKEICNYLFFKMPVSEAMREWQNIHNLYKVGIPTIKPVAVGEKFPNPFYQESFLVTEGLEDFKKLVVLVRDFKPPISWEMLEKKRLLIKGVASLVRNIHRKGFNHRDLYLNHIMAKPDNTSGFILKIIDLQRVECRKWFRMRWLIKDIAALNYSAPSSVFTMSDRMRFYKEYAGINRLTDGDKKFIKGVIKKTKRIGGHTVRMYKKRNERKKRGLLER